MEVWKDIKGFEGCYQISNLGRVKSLERVTVNGRIVHERILKSRVNKQGYEYICLQFNGSRKAVKIHREVAKAFIPNECDYPEVNHKDENKLNNSAPNLEWCSRIYNANYGTAKERAVTTRLQRHKLKIDQFSLDGEYIKTWDAPYLIEKATQGKMKATNIIACCKGRYKTSYDYVWRYSNK